MCAYQKSGSLAEKAKDWLGIDPSYEMTYSEPIDQVVSAAWYRHAIRPVVQDGALTLLLTHAIGAVLVLAGVAILARRLRQAVACGEAPSQLKNAPRRLKLLLGLQVALGVLAWLGFRPDTVGPLEWTLTIAHVLGGGLLLAQTAAVWCWCLRPAFAARTRFAGGVL